MWSLVGMDVDQIHCACEADSAGARNDLAPVAVVGARRGEGAGRGRWVTGARPQGEGAEGILRPIAAHAPDYQTVMRRRVMMRYATRDFRYARLRPLPVDQGQRGADVGGTGALGEYTPVPGPHHTLPRHHYHSPGTDHFADGGDLADTAHCLFPHPHRAYPYAGACPYPGPVHRPDLYCNCPEEAQSPDSPRLCHVRRGGSSDRPCGPRGASTPPGNRRCRPRGAAPAPGASPCDARSAPHPRSRDLPPGVRGDCCRAPTHR
jgi:hypothetical protein